MLDSLIIRNYRNLKEFAINSLGQINVITGQNNTGKSSLLEAVSIYATKGEIHQIYEILAQRGEYLNNEKGNKPSIIIEHNIKSLSSMFYNRELRYDIDGSISIGKSGKSINIRFIKYMEIAEGNGIIRGRIRIDNPSEFKNEYNTGLEISYNGEEETIPLDKDLSGRFGYKEEDSEALQFIRTANLDRLINGKLFDNIALTEKEDYIIDALKIIEPKTERIAFVEENNERVAVIKLSNYPQTLPLKSMGDGINRILTIILALVNSANGYLLIDEFENGLHHSVQEQLWKIIFKLAKSLNVQVFATTHSEDSISSFGKVLNYSGNALTGKLFRLDDIDGKIVPVEFSSEELKIANEQDIEIR